MSNFFKETRNKRKARREWASKFKESYEKAMREIEKHQERELLTSQNILLALAGGFCINILASSVYHILSVFNSLSLVNILMETLLLVVFGTILVVIYMSLRKQLLKYKPSNPILVSYVTPEDTAPFLTPKEFQTMETYMEKGKFRDFRAFGNMFFESLEKWFSHMFNPEITKEPLMKSEEPDPLKMKEFPTIIHKYDISSMSTTGVKVYLEVILRPHVIYTFPDGPAVYNFYITFRFNILNPEHQDAGRFLDEYYHLYLSNIVEFCSYCVASAFRLPPRSNLKSSRRI